ncbi:MAG TPA: hypothetical protein VMT10_15265 [Solirubrobacteraceae bacterium]|nr:hypothetical protein [Solirubrobacteraceae bacterium]
MAESAKQPEGSEHTGASAENAVLFTAVYDDLVDARSDLDAFEELHKADVIGKYDAAIINQQDGKPHIVKRVDHPVIRVIPEWLGSGALPRGELHDAAKHLAPGQSALVVVGEPTLDKAFDRAVVRAAKTVRHDLDAAIDEIEKELLNAGKE